MTERHNKHSNGVAEVDCLVYTPLKHSDSIRLIKIVSTDELKCELHHHKLRSATLPRYSALSYVWGDVFDRVPIICNDKQHFVTRSLHEGLRHIPQHNPFEYVWADQLCINQLDNEERSQQLKIMGLIFQASNFVIAWLGPEDETTVLGVEQIQKVATIAEALEEDELTQVGGMGNKQAEDLGISFEDNARWYALSKVFDRPWFQRIWIVQEMLPAQNQNVTAMIEAQVVIGHHVMSWETVKLAASWIFYKGNNRPQPDDVDVDGVSLTVGMRLQWASRFAHGHARGGSLGRFRFRALELLSHFRNRLATDPKDKVYALLGLSDLDIGYKLEPQSCVPIDYTRSVLQIFRDATRAVIEHSRDLSDQISLDILISATPRSEEDGWPSWVPDWRITDIADAGVRLLAGRPAGDVPVRLLEPPDEDSLKVAGVLIGSACYVYSERHAGDIIWRRDVRALQQYCIDSLLSNYPTGEDVATAFTLTLSAGRISQSAKRAGMSPQVYANSILGFIDALKLPENTEDERTHRYAMIKPFTEMGHGMKWSDVYLASCCERRLFITDRGYLGLGNHHMVTGDVIAILFGLHVPCVLRPLSNRPEDGYAFIGEAYVHGAMDGEAVKDLPRDVDGLARGDEILLR